MRLEEGVALGKPLGMGIDFPDFFEPGPGADQETVLHLHDFFAHDVDIVVPDQVVHSGDAARRRVFDGQDTVLDASFLHGLDHIVKGRIRFGSQGAASKILLHGQITVGPRHALVADMKSSASQHDHPLFIK